MMRILEFLIRLTVAVSVAGVAYVIVWTACDLFNNGRLP